MNTIFFGSRWLPLDAVFLLLALPAPSLGRISIKAVTFATAAAFFVAAAVSWHAWAAEDLSGFRRFLAKIPPASRFLGLDFVQTSGIIEGRPFLRLFAYAQVFKD